MDAINEEYRRAVLWVSLVLFVAWTCPQGLLCQPTASLVPSCGNESTTPVYIRMVGCPKGGITLHQNECDLIGPIENISNLALGFQILENLWDSELTRGSIYHSVIELSCRETINGSRLQIDVQIPRESFVRGLDVLVSQLRWDHIIIITDYERSHSELYIQLLDILSGYPAIFEEHVLSANNIEGDIRELLERHTKTGNLLEQMHFIVVCNITCIQELFLQANMHDSLYDEQGFLTYKDRWLLLATESELQQIQPFVVNITHVTAYVLTNVYDQYIEDLILGSMEDFYFVQDDNYSYVYAVASDLCSENLETSGTCETGFTVGRLYSAAWVTSGREFTAIGEFNGEVMKQWEDIFPNENYGFNGRHFIVSTNIWGSFVKRITDKDDSIKYTGVAIEILTEASLLLNFSFTLREPADGGWGTHDAEGMWTGLVGDLTYKKADLMAAPLAVYSDREGAMDFITAFHVEYSAFIYKPPNQDDQRIFLLIKPFAMGVWMCLALAIPVTGFIIFAMSRMSPYYGTSQLCEREFGNLGRAIWFTFGSMMAQGSTVSSPGPSSVRFAVGGWWLTVLVIIATYSGNLIATLAVNTLEPPFITLEELSTDATYKVGTIHSTVWHQLLENSELPSVYAKLWQKIESAVSSGDDDVLATSGAVHMEKVEKGGYAYLTDETVAQGFLSDSCELAIMQERFFPMLYAMGTQNNSAYRNLFSELVLRMKETGLVGRWYQQNSPFVPGCEMGILQRPISANDLLGIIYIALCVMVLACLVLFSEIIYHAIRARFNRYKRRILVMRAYVARTGTKFR